MNQILGKRINKKKYLIILFFSIFALIIIILYLIYFYYNLSMKQNFSKKLMNNFNLENLYLNSNQNYEIINLNENCNYFIIGIIEISKINIKYPILSTINDELLKISPCRFYGCYPNEFGNLCIAGHNYDNSTFFSDLYKLDIGDIINIYDSKNTCISYYIYSKYETSMQDTSCTKQDINKKEITLVTCNNLNKKRLIIKACEKK